MRNFSTLLTVLSACLMVSAAAFDSKAQKIDFDQGPIVSDNPPTHKTSKMVMALPLPIEIKVLKTASIHTLGGFVFGPFQPAILGSHAYKSAMELLEPIKHLPDQAQVPLTKEWKTVESVRLDLLQTRNLESTSKSSVVSPLYFVQ